MFLILIRKILSKKKKIREKPYRHLITNRHEIHKKRLKESENFTLKIKENPRSKLLLHVYIMIHRLEMRFQKS